MANYAKQLPLDKNNYPFPAPPAFVSQQSQGGVPTASSVLTLSANTTVLSVMVIGGASGNSGIMGKWGTASVTASNFDFIVNSGQVQPFVVPVSVFGAPLASVAGVNAANGLYTAVALKTITAQSASVFTTEY